MSARSGVIFLLSILFLAPLAVPAEARTSAVKGTEIERVLNRIAEEQEKVQTLQAEFRQEKSLSLMAKPQVSSGSFLFARPNQVLWTYRKPKAVEMLISDGWLTTYYPDLRKAERVEVSRYEERIFRYLGAAAGAIDDLEQYFDFKLVDARSEPAYTLELKPKSPRIAKRVQRIKIWIDKKSYLTTAVEWVEGDGDMTRYRFTDLRVNAPIAASKFQLTLPSGVKVETLAVSSSR